jgi:4'-phosphopantetheinyl transferase EntD
LIWLDEDNAAPGLAPRGLDCPDTVVCIARIGSLACDLFPEEEAFIAKSVASRRLQFETARALARRCMRALGLPPCAILRRPDRSPVWPAGTVGSLSHCRHLAVAALSGSLKSIGVDVECTGRIESKLHALLFTEREQAVAAGEPGATAIFGAKEALFKALHPLTGVRSEFREFEVALDLAAGRFQARYLGPSAAQCGDHEGFVAADSGHVLAVAIKEPRHRL